MSQRAKFLRLSATLTGFAIKAIDNKNFPIKIAPNEQLPVGYYLAICKQRLGPDFVSRWLLKPTPNQVRKNAKTEDSRQAKAARALTKLWYTGVWIQPYEYSSQTSGKVYKQGEQYIVNAIGYKRGLMWLAAQAHAMGYSELDFGYWHAQPTQSLQDLMKGKK